MHIYSYFLVVSLALNGLYISPALYTYILKYNLSVIYNAAYMYAFKADCHWIDCSWCALLWGRLLKCPRWRMIYYLDWDSSKDLQNPPEAISISLVYTAAGDCVDVPGPVTIKGHIGVCGHADVVIHVATRGHIDFCDPYCHLSHVDVCGLCCCLRPCEACSLY